MRGGSHVGQAFSLKDKGALITGESRDIDRTIAFPRFGEPEEMSSLALFLPFKASACVTGEIIQADGGQTI
jgi:hypothetical protein